MTPLPLAALVLGAVGSTHCVAMCGGIVGLAQAGHRRPSLPMADAPKSAALVVAAQHAGRLASYAAAGAIAGGAGHFAIGRWQAALEIAAGVAMVALGLFLTGLLPSFAVVEKLGAPLWRSLQPLTRRLLPLRTPWHALAFGALWGWLPCGLVYSALSLAILSGSPAGGAVAMLAFGAGTLPALISVAALVRWLGRFAQIARLRVAAGALVVTLGALHLTLAAGRMHAPQTSCHAGAHEANEAR